MSADGLQAPTPDVDRYGLGDAVATPGFDAVPAGTNLLVSGSPMLGKEEIVLDLLAAGSWQAHAIAVTPSTAGESLRERFQSRHRATAERLHVVDCTGATGKGSMDDDERVKYVNSPGDLTGIGVGIVKSTRAVGDDVDEGLRLALLSASTLSRYADAQRVFNFLHTVTGRVSAAGYLGVATMDPTTMDTQAVNTITSLFDGVVELREADDGDREMRTVGWPDAPRTWHPY